MDEIVMSELEILTKRGRQLAKHSVVPPEERQAVDAEVDLEFTATSGVRFTLWSRSAALFLS